MQRNVYLPPAAMVARYRRRPVSLIALASEALLIAAGFFALGFALVVAAAVFAPV